MHDPDLTDVLTIADRLVASYDDPAVMEAQLAEAGASQRMGLTSESVPEGARRKRPTNWQPELRRWAADRSLAAGLAAYRGSRDRSGFGPRRTSRHGMPKGETCGMDCRPHMDAGARRAVRPVPDGLYARCLVSILLLCPETIGTRTAAWTSLKNT